MILDGIAKEFGRGLRFIDGGDYKTKDPDFVFKESFLRLQAGAVISLKKETQQERPVLERIACTRIL